jgi:adenosylmethionine-8-amino-7-oxononanoate aminotransferase
MRVDLGKSSTIYRELEGKIDKIVQGKGPYLYTDDGRVLFDLSGGPCVTSLGHSNFQLIEAVSNQLRTVPYVYSGFWGNDPAEQLGDLIRNEFEETWPGWFGKVAFACAGNEAVDFACRIAAQYHIENGEPRRHFAARKYAFHGVGLLSSALTDDYGRYMLMTAWYSKTREEYLRRLPGYHGNFENGAVEVYESELLEQTEQIIATSFKNADPIAGLILEPVGGPPVGCAAPTKKYLQGLREICNRWGILLIFDEVLCGSGRVGAFTAGQIFDVPPDIVILGKGLTSGYIPLSAIVVSNKVLYPIRQGSKVLMTGTTYFDHATACACGVATMKYLRDHHLYKKVHDDGEQMLHYMAQELSKIPIVKMVHGAGFLWGVQLARPDGTPWYPTMQMHKVVRQALYDARIVCYSKGQTVDGRNDYLIFAPPFETSLGKLKLVIDEVATVLNTIQKQLDTGLRRSV